MRGLGGNALPDSDPQRQATQKRQTCEPDTRHRDDPTRQSPEGQKDIVSSLTPFAAMFER
jgi:hypothetical protein